MLRPPPESPSTPWGGSLGSQGLSEAKEGRPQGLPWCPQTQESRPHVPFSFRPRSPDPKPPPPQTQESGPEIPLRSLASLVSIPGQIPTLCSHLHFSQELQARH